MLFTIVKEGPKVVELVNQIGKYLSREALPIREVHRAYTKPPDMKKVEDL